MNRDDFTEDSSDDNETKLKKMIGDDYKETCDNIDELIYINTIKSNSNSNELKNPEYAAINSIKNDINYQQLENDFKLTGKPIVMSKLKIDTSNKSLTDTNSVIYV